MRRLLNLAYAIRAEGLEESGLRQLDRELEADPAAQAAKPQGRNVEALMGMAPRIGR